ncbi:hypothetical protein [Fluoribacter gormanii]|uniref:hypothetical protein n=1 Tax=Fluoribacter gormanii TaxID=464 RepID=UPI00104193D8|nr:hypothetical protein [Fluoribacter gormanii]
MMTVLIVTEPDDFHSVLVKLALKEKGIACDLFFSADMPSKQENSIVINNAMLKWSSICADKITRDMTSRVYSTIWWRRPRQPHIPSDYAHPDDLKFIKRENYVYFQSLPHLLSKESWWINPISSQDKVKSKIYQLKLASECGFNLPASLISNSPDDIRSFILDSGDTPVVYKSFTPNSWHDDNGFNMLYTQKIQLDDLPSDEMIRIVPGIYQHYVEKLYELRITCFGSHISAIKIDSQKSNITKTDWRKTSANSLELHEVEIPNHIKNLIILYMKKMNIVFGCFDFIVTPEEEYIFLEVNEQGQFLWVEDILPQTHYLDVFCSFMMNRSFNFSWVPHKNALCLADYNDEALKIVNENIANHVYLNEIKRTA